MYPCTSEAAIVHSVINLLLKLSLPAVGPPPNASIKCRLITYLYLAVCTVSTLYITHRKQVCYLHLMVRPKNSTCDQNHPPPPIHTPLCGTHRLRLWIVSLLHHSHGHQLQRGKSWTSVLTGGNYRVNARRLFFFLR